MSEGRSNNGEFLFLSGPRSRWKDFKGALKIFVELIRGFRKLHFVGPCITVFGSARITENDDFYKDARYFGRSIAERGFTVLTGGGPGIMEAANRGAKDINGTSVGCNIRLPKEQLYNAFLDVQITLEHFYVRKVLLLKYSYAFIAMPGGFGTIDELFETLTLIQTKKIKQFPIVLFGTSYWSGLINQLDKMKEIGSISPKDQSLFLITDSVEESMDYILDKLKLGFGKDARYRPIKTRWWLGEKPIKSKNKYVIKVDG